MKLLSDYTNIELFQHGSEVLAKMCESMTKSHLTLASVFQDDNLATDMLQTSLRTCLEGVGDILNAIELIDDELAKLSDPLFEELARRFPEEHPDYVADQMID